MYYTMKVQEVKDSVEKAAAEAKKELAKVQKTLEDAGKKAEKYIQSNPKKAAAVSAGIGAALGAALAMLVGRKKK